MKRITKTYDLRGLPDALTKAFPAVTRLYVFGSRRFNTQSARSDIDVLVFSDTRLLPSNLRDFITSECKALDLFVADRGIATSAANESYIEFADDQALIEGLKATLLWSKQDGLATLDFPSEQPYLVAHDYPMSALPERGARLSYQSYKNALADDGLPTDPILGENYEEIATTLARIGRNIVPPAKGLNKQGKASAWAVKPENEYQLQDLFYMAVRPWLLSLEREKVAVRYDGQVKKVDFAALKSKILVEIKFAKDKNDAREISKTLSGLAGFYGEHPSVAVLLFLIYTCAAADIDGPQWEADFSSASDGKYVIVQVIPVPTP